jgi:acyl-CoA synthetase (AMP-forming)/AMP-acid ligase II
MNIVDPILHHCRINAEQPAICAPGTRFDLVTYAQLEYMINNLTRALLPLGFEPGQVVGILVQDKIFHVALLLALTRVGVVTTSCSAPSVPPEIGATAVITDTADTVSGVKRVIRANPDWVKGGGGAAVDPRQFKATGNETCRIFLTSGTTGVPKGVALSHRMLMGRNVQFDYAFGGHWPQHSRIYCDLGLASEPAFRFTLYMLMRGGMIMFVGQDAIGTEQSLDLFKIQSMVASPRGLAEHLKFYEHTAVRCGLDHILAMGGSVPAELLQRVWARMCPDVFGDYGATEVGSVASADLRHVNDTPGRTGYVVPPASIEAVSEDDVPVGPNTEGIIRLRTPTMATGYVGQPAVSAQVFRNGWFYPGDYGYVTQDGLLVITGRMETRINVGGDKIDPGRIEDVLRAFAGVEDAAVLTVPNSLGLEDVYALIQADSLADTEALRSHCQSKLSRNFVPVRFIAVGRIPRSETGKIQRGELLELAKSRLA